MNEYQEELTEMLINKNNKLSYNQARIWVELLWDDFETTYAKAGWEYKGSEMAGRIVKQWIENYGDKLHEFVATNPKYKQFLSEGEVNSN